MSNEFKLVGQRVMLIDTPGIEERGISCEKLIELIKGFLAISYVKT